jgi:hypothetical protein
MSKLSAYAMPKYEFRLGLAWAPQTFFSRGVDLICSVANFELQERIRLFYKDTDPYCFKEVKPYFLFILT